MAGLQNPLPLLELGQLYVSFDALKDNAYTGKIPFYCGSKETSRVIYKCKNPTRD